jgi:hypothetical protein
MNFGESAASSSDEAQEIARQADIELGIVLGIEQSLRIALQWATRGRGNTHKLSTLRFHTSTFERHLTRIQALAVHGGYKRLIIESSPRLAGAVNELGAKRVNLHAELERIVIRLDLVSRDDGDAFGSICTDLERCLDALRTNAQKERDLLRQTFTQEKDGWG